jgi:hypothetical protein
LARRHARHLLPTENVTVVGHWERRRQSECEIDSWNDSGMEEEIGKEGQLGREREIKGASYDVHFVYLIHAHFCCHTHIFFVLSHTHFAPFSHTHSRIAFYGMFDHVSLLRPPAISIADASQWSVHG